MPRSATWCTNYQPLGRLCGIVDIWVILSIYYCTYVLQLCAVKRLFHSKQLNDINLYSLRKSANCKLEEGTEFSLRCDKTQSNTQDNAINSITAI